MNDRLEIHPGEALFQISADHIATLLSESVRLYGRASIALAGGSTPRSIYSLLGSDTLYSQIPWTHVHLFWGDERCVPPDHPESNYGMTAEALLRHINIPPENVHRIKGEADPLVAADEYEREIRQTLSGGGTICIDVVLLGLGEDGHTASLFPGTSALTENTRLVTEVYVEKLKAHRITLTLVAINNARHILFLVAGRGKAKILAGVIQKDSVLYPAQRVRPVSGDVLWLVDQEAASDLTRGHQR